MRPIRRILVTLVLGTGAAVLVSCSKPKPEKLPPKTETLAEPRVRAGVSPRREGPERDPLPARAPHRGGGRVRIEDGGSRGSAAT
ncbi:MAG: hypothetical protein U0414_15360 [Polyangiaceae bacterium]